MQRNAVAGAVVVGLAAAAGWLPDLRRSLVRDVTWWDARPSETAALPPGTGPALSPTPRTRVVLFDGLSAPIASALPAWGALCKRGITLRVDVGFPTISLPVQVALWTGLTQQQTGIVSRNGGKAGSYGRPLDPPLDRRGIPAQVPHSIGIAEDHGWIVRSLGFSRFEPPADPSDPTKDLDLPAWRQRWEQFSIEAVASNATLVFVHILRVDTAGHVGGMGWQYAMAAAQADALLGKLVAADPTARWFVLSDHGHIAPGGHGGEERGVRQVQACITGPGVVAGTGELVHIVDIARALADSTGATLSPDARGRPLTAALAAPLAEDQAVPPIELARGVVAVFLLVAGLALAAWSIRTWWLAPWWFVVAVASVYVLRGEPTLSMAMTYRADGQLLYTAWLAALPIALVTTYVGFGRTTLARVLAAQLAVPVFATAATMAAAGAWPVVFGAETSPTVPRYTAWMLALLLMAAHGAAAVALAVLARLARPAFDRFVRARRPRSEPSTGA